MTIDLSYIFTAPMEGLYYFHWHDLQGKEHNKHSIFLKEGDTFSFPEDIDPKKKYSGSLR